MSILMERVRAIEAALQPLQGTVSAGHVLARATGASVTVQAGSVLYPVEERARHEASVRVTADTVVTSSGVLVPVESIQGGRATVVPPGTRFTFWPAIAGVREVAGCDGGVSGGVDAIGGIRRVLLAQEAPNADPWTWATTPGNAPCAVIYWSDSTNGAGESQSVSTGGSAVPEYASESDVHWVDRFIITLVTHYPEGRERIEQLYSLHRGAVSALSQQSVVRGFSLSDTMDSRVIRVRGGALQSNKAPSRFFAAEIVLDTFSLLEADHSHITPPQPWLGTDMQLTDREPVGDEAVYVDASDNYPDPGPAP